MSLQAILAQIETVGEQQILEIQAKSSLEIQAALTTARANAEQIYDAAFQQALKPSAPERARILGQAGFDSICLLGNARDSLVKMAVAQLCLQLEDLRSYPSYPSFLQRAVFEVLSGMGETLEKEGCLVLEADPRDREILETILPKDHRQIPVDFCLNCWGGIIARSTDGNTRLVNTLESRLDRALPFLKQQFLAWFSKEDGYEEERLALKIRELA